MAAPSSSTKNVYDAVPLPLGDTMCIRVLKIRPATRLDGSDPIVCDFSILNVASGTLLLAATVPKNCLTREDELEEHNGSKASNRNQYRARSYTWDDPPAYHAIVLHGAAFNVRKNLWDFLSLARNRALDTYFWIDAICIDQETVREWNHQVGRMGVIYCSAGSVIVWLGDCSEDTAKTLNSVFTEAKQWKRWTPMKSEMKLALRLNSKSPWRLAVTDIFHRPYWNRAWIAQEYLLAVRLDLWYGSLRAQSEDLEETIAWMTNSYRDVNYPAYAREVYQSPAHNILKYRHVPGLNVVDPVAHQKFIHLLWNFKVMQSADRRDRIYALLPLLTQKQRVELGIVPNYDESVVSLFLNVAERIYINHGYDLLLGVISTLNNMLQPDFTDRVAQRRILTFRRTLLLRGEVIPNPVRLEDHECEGRDNPHPVFDIHGCALCRKTPTLTMHSDFETEFPRRDWQSWATALLGSDDPEDQDFGFKILRDKYFGRRFKLLSGAKPRHSTVCSCKPGMRPRRRSSGQATSRNERWSARSDGDTLRGRRSTSC